MPQSKAPCTITRRHPWPSSPPVKLHKLEYHNSGDANGQWQECGDFSSPGVKNISSESTDAWAQGVAALPVYSVTVVTAYFCFRLKQRLSNVIHFPSVHNSYVGMLCIQFFVAISTRAAATQCDGPAALGIACFLFNLFYDKRVQLCIESGYKFRADLPAWCLGCFVDPYDSPLGSTRVLGHEILNDDKTLTHASCIAACCKAG